MSLTTFPIPSSLQDLERAPYNLLPYPTDFDDDDEVARAESFDRLVHIIECGNDTLFQDGMTLFQEEETIVWNNQERIQAMYTLARKSSSLAKGTTVKFIKALCKAIRTLSSILSSSDKNSPSEVGMDVVSQSFRDAWACHLYMLFSVMFMKESEAKHAKKAATGMTTKTPKKSKKKGSSNNNNLSDEKTRELCAQTMLNATQSMGKFKSKLWKRGVPDETVIQIPCRISYQILEISTGVLGRKAASGDAALGMIGAIIQHYSNIDSIISTIVAAVLDLLHTYEHMTVLIADLCSITTKEEEDQQSNPFAVELLREIGHLEMTEDKASGVKFVAPFVQELASRQPKLVWAHIHMILPHLDQEPYYFRSSIVNAIGQIIRQTTNLTSINDEEEKENEVDTNKSDEDDDDEELLSPSKRKIAKKVIPSKSRDYLLNLLLERGHDTSSFTRSTVLKTWASLVQNGQLPLNRLMPVTGLAIGRLEDKAVIVRRSAMQLLTLLLENNPFMGSLDPKPYLVKVKELETYLFEHMPDDLKEAEQAAQNDVSDDDCDEKDEQNDERQKIKYAALEAAIEQVEEQDTENMSDGDSEFFKRAKILKFARSALIFINLFEEATNMLDSMLLSTNTSDVTETLRFFVRARHFQLPCAISGMRAALALMWSNEKSIQDEVIIAFTEVFLAVPGSDGQELLPHDEIANNLLILTSQASVSELASIEEAIRRVVKDEKIPPEVFLYLWTIVSRTSEQSRASALLVLSMGAKANPSILDSASKLRSLLDSGLGDHTEETRDWKTARAASCLLQNMTPIKPDPHSAKYLVIEMILERLCVVVHGNWCNDADSKDTKEWFGAAEQAINAIFILSYEPESICKMIIRVLEATTFGFGTESPHQTCHSLQLSRFFFVVSHMALKLLVYTETLSGSVRRANAARTLAKQEEADKAKTEKKKKRSESEMKDEESDDDSDDDIEAELGMAQAAEAETELQVAEISEKEIIGKGLIGLFSPLLIRIVANDDGIFSSSEILNQTATLALCKFMCISRSFCEKYLPLLFTALAKAPVKDTTLRANTVIALGDLAFRFPNEVEPYTPHLYACLRDSSTRVRRHTLMVLTHLILNDMVKVKGQVCEIALCLQDEEIRIRDMARLLFHELSKRSNNPIYNLLPDIVSRLSQMTIPKDSFRSILSFLLNFIKKERQIEMLVDKLCQRFPKCSSISQKADIAFCLAQLKPSEKCIKTMMDNFKLYKDALFDDDVHKNFMSIIVKAKKIHSGNNLKPELKQALMEWEENVKKCSAASLENHLADKNAKQAKQKSQRRAANRRSRKATQHVESDGESEEEDSSEEEDEEISEEEEENSISGDEMDKENIIEDDTNIHEKVSSIQHAKKHNRKSSKRGALRNVTA